MVGSWKVLLLELRDSFIVVSQGRCRHLAWVSLICGHGRISLKSLRFTRHLHSGKHIQQVLSCNSCSCGGNPDRQAPQCVCRYVLASVQFPMLWFFFPFDNYFCFLKRNFTDQNLCYDICECAWVGCCVCTPLVVVYIPERVWMPVYGL